MSKRDFDAEFDSIIAVDAAASDTTLRYFYWDRIYGHLPASQEAHERIEDEICHVYNLTSEQYHRARGAVVAKLVGIKTGREMFKYDG